MGILDKKKEFAFVNNASVATSSNVNEFISSGSADKGQNKEKKNKGGRPKKKGDKLVSLTLYVSPKEKEILENEANKLHMSISSYLKFKILA